MNKTIKKLTLILIAICIAITGTGMKVSAEAYKSSASKKVSYKPDEQYVSLSFTLKKEATVNITLKAMDKKTVSFEIDHGACQTCNWDKNPDARFCKSNDNSKKKITIKKLKLQKGKHIVVISTPFDQESWGTITTDTQTVKLTVKDTSGKNNVKINKDLSYIVR